MDVGGALQAEAVCEDTQKWARAWGTRVMPRGWLPGTQGPGMD